MQKRAALSVTPAKMLLFAAAVSIYCFAAVVIVSATDALVFSMIIAFVPAIAYVAAGGAAIHFAELIRRWSFPVTYHEWNEELRVSDLHRDIDRLQADNARLRAEIDSVKKSTYAVERIAREDLGMSKKGEVTYMLPVSQSKR